MLLHPSWQLSDQTSEKLLHKLYVAMGLETEESKHRQNNKRKRQFLSAALPVQQDLKTPNPVSLLRHEWTRISSNDERDDYVIGEKTDGIRYWIWCTWLDQQPTVLWINRACKMWRVPVRAKPSVFGDQSFTTFGHIGTLVDAELANGFLIMFDLYIDGGTLMTSESFDKRVARLEHFCRSVDFSPVLHHKDRLVRKQFLPLNRIGELFNVEKTALLIGNQTSVDGLVFMSISKPLRFGKDVNLFKWKQHHTVDFLVNWQVCLPSTEQLMNGVNVIMFVQCLFFLEDEKNALILVGEHNMPLVQLESLFTLDKMKQQQQQQQQSLTIPSRFVLECDIHALATNFHNNLKTTKTPIIDVTLLSPIKVRDDKNKPNSYYTFTKTMENVLESIDIHDLLKPFSI